MPFISERQSFLKEIDLSALRSLSVDWDEEDTEEFSELLDVKACCESTRYFNLREYVTNKNRSINDALFLFSDKDFTQTVRMNKRSFIRLVNMIQRDK